MSEVPDWMDDLVRTVADAMTAHGVPGPLGLRYREDEGAWEVLVYQLPVELVGGRHDGEVVSPGFSVDLEAVRSAFTRMENLFWQAPLIGEQHEAPMRADRPDGSTGPHAWNVREPTLANPVERSTGQRRQPGYPRLTSSSRTANRRRGPSRSRCRIAKP